MSDQVNKKRSDVWNHFTLETQGKAKCRYCSNILSYVGGATGNLGRQYKSQHKTVTLQRIRYLPVPRPHMVPNNVPQVFTEERQEMSITEGSSSTTEIISTRTTRATSTTIQGSISSYVRSPIPLSLSKKYDEQLIRTIVKGFHPFRMVEDVEFKKLITMLCPAYTMPTRKTVSNSLIPRLYSKTKIQQMPYV